MTLPIMRSEMGITELRRLTLRHDTSPYNNCSIALSKCCSWWDFLYTIVARRLRATTRDRISTSPCFASYSESYWGGGWSLKFLVSMEYYLVWNGMHTPTRRAVLFVSLECCFSLLRSVLVPQISCECWHSRIPIVNRYVITSVHCSAKKMPSHHRCVFDHFHSLEQRRWPSPSSMHFRLLTWSLPSFPDVVDVHAMQV